MKGKKIAYISEEAIWSEPNSLHWDDIILYIYVYTVKTNTVEVIQTRAIQDAPQD
jgi:hypothetical protein